MFEPVDGNLARKKESVGHREDDGHERAVQEEQMDPEKVGPVTI